MNTGEVSPHLPRRLAAIVCGDIVGYSRLMGLDEEGTHARVMHHRRDIIEPTIAEHQGRIVKHTGDGFVALFDSPLEAVRCAIVIQQSVAARNTSLPKASRVEYRIGVNLGDVIVEKDDIYGDGVNIAARLETSAAPGTVNISGGVYEQIKNKLVCGYQSHGDEKLKNITDPVRIYRVLPDPAAVQAYSRNKVWFGSVTAATVLMAMGGTVAYYFTHERQPVAAAQQPSTIASTAAQSDASLNAQLPAPPALPAPVPMPVPETRVAALSPPSQSP